MCIRDSTITEGQAAIDESAITGESMPVDKSIGDPVTGATLCRSGYFTMQATDVYKRQFHGLPPWASFSARNSA